MSRDTYAIIVNLYDLVHKERAAKYWQYKDEPEALVSREAVNQVKILADAAREGGLKVAVIFDYFVQNPYHGKPPHVLTETGKISKSRADRAKGLGYIPFAWGEGWNYARKAIAAVAETVNPDYVQQGIDHATMNWYREGGPAKPHWGYNDVMGMFNQGLVEDAGWAGIYVVSAYHNLTQRKARSYFGRAIRDTDLLQIITFELPPTEPPIEPPPPVDPPTDPPPPDPPPSSEDYVTKGELHVIMLALTEVIEQISADLAELEEDVEELEKRVKDLEDESDEIPGVINDMEKLRKVFGWLL